MLCSFESLPAPNITAPLPRPPNQDPELVAVSALQREASPLPFSRKTPDSTLTPWSFLENPPTLGLNIKPVLRLQVNPTPAYSFATFSKLTSGADAARPA
jgi:hypothetical protein